MNLKTKDKSFGLSVLGNTDKELDGPKGSSSCLETAKEADTEEDPKGQQKVKEEPKEKFQKSQDQKKKPHKEKKAQAREESKKRTQAKAITKQPKEGALEQKVCRSIWELSLLRSVRSSESAMFF